MGDWLLNLLLPEMPLGIIFGLLVGFVAVQVWNDFDRAKLAVATEASALRGIVILAETFPAERRGELRRLVNRHIEHAVTQEWGSMAQRRLTMKPCRPISSRR